MDGVAFLIALLFGSYLVNSLWTGETGFRGIMVRKDEKPLMFWVFTLAYAGFVVLSLFETFRPAWIEF